MGDENSMSLINENELYKLILDSTADWETLSDKDNKFIYVSPSCEIITGYSNDEFLKNNMFFEEIIHPDDLTTFKEHHSQNFLNPASIQKIIFRIITKDKKIKWIEHRCQSMFIKEFDFIGHRGSNRDITDVKLLELENIAFIELLRIINRSEKIEHLIKLSTTFLKNWLGCEAIGIRLQEGSDFPYYETIGFPELFIRAERFLCHYDFNGNPHRDFLGNPILECMCGNIICGRFDSTKPFFTENGSFWSNGTTELLANTTENDRQNRTRNRCNGEGYESVGLFPLRYNNSTFGLLQINDKRKNLFSENVIKFLERYTNNLAIALNNKYVNLKIHENEKQLNELNISKNKFFSIIAHDLKGPLGSILGLTELLQKSFIRNDYVKASSISNHINSSAKQTFSLLENLLEWASSQQGTTQFKPDQIDLDIFFKDEITNLTEIASLKGININFELQGNFFVYADKNMLKTVIRNLVTNAIKFSYNGGQVKLSAIEYPSEVIISVTDNGIGMDSNTKSKLFKMESGVTTLGTANEKGTGLGLLLCKEFVSKHKGKIWVESELGLGSIFSISIPKNA